MISSTLGAPLGGTSCGGHHALDSGAVRLMTPPNFGSGAGSCFPSMVAVALGEPSVPVTCCARALAKQRNTTNDMTPTAIALIRLIIACLQKGWGKCRPG